MTRKPDRYERLFESVLRTADALQRAEVQVIREAELTFPQYNVLRILRGAGREGLSCGAISERMVNRDSDITRLLDRLQERGLVSRARDEDDRRVIIASISERGSALLADLDEPVRRALEKEIEHLPADEVDLLIEGLDRVRSGG